MVLMVDVVTKLPKSYLTALGGIAVNWATLEWHIERILWALLKLGPKEGRIMTVPMSMKPKLETLKLLADRLIKDAKVKAEVLKFCDAVALISENRNKVTHGIWARLQNKPRSYCVIWARGSGQNRILPKRFPITAKQLENIKHALVGHNGYASSICQYFSNEQLP